MPWAFAAVAAVGVMSAMSSWQAGTKQANAEKAYQRYRNKMTKLSDAQNQNAITQNVTNAIQASAKQAVENQSAAIQAEGTARVASAAAGSGGNTASRSMWAVERTVANIEYQRQEGLKDMFLNSEVQRKQSAMNAALQVDKSYIPTPSSASLILGVAKAVVSSYAAYASGGAGGGGGGMQAGQAQYGMST